MCIWFDMLYVALAELCRAYNVQLLPEYISISWWVSGADRAASASYLVWGPLMSHDWTNSGQGGQWTEPMDWSMPLWHCNSGCRWWRFGFESISFSFPEWCESKCVCVCVCMCEFVTVPVTEQCSSVLLILPLLYARPLVVLSCLVLHTIDWQSVLHFNDPNGNEPLPSEIKHYRFTVTLMRYTCVSSNIVTIF